MTWDKALKIEYRIALIQAHQELYGVRFDLDLAYDLLAELDDELDCIDSKLMAGLPHQVRGDENHVKTIKRKDGEYTINVKNYWGDPSNVGGIYCRVSFERFNLNSHAQVKDYLLSQGWEPTQWNEKDGEKTSPKITEDSFDSVAHLEMPKLIGRRNVLRHRRNTICNIKDPKHKGWIANVRKDGRLEARAQPQATNTGRYRHSLVVNVPKADPNVVYGYEMRSLFTVPEGKLMLGCDASGLEARMEAHYCYPYEGGKEYAHELIDGDVHQKNAELFGTDRNGAKAPKYAMTYGAQPPKIAETLGIGLARARRLFNAFWDGNTALAGFRDDCVVAYNERGWLKGIDGRQIKIRSPHSAVNAEFQSAGSIVVKVATLFLNKWIKERGIDAHQVLHMHDEFQWEIWPQDEEIVTELALKAFQKAGEFLGIRVPIIGEVKVGKNWAETH